MTTISAGTTSTTAYVATPDTTGTLVLKTGASNATALTLDASGNLALGTTSFANQARLQIAGGRSYFGSNDSVYAVHVAYNNTRVQAGQGYYIGATDSATPSLVFSNNDGTERARIDSSGNLLVGTTSRSSTERLKVDNTDTLVAWFQQSTNTSGYNGITVGLGQNGNNTSTSFFRGNTNNVGNWYLYGNGTTSFSSDERLKKNIETTRDGYIDDVMKLRVVKYNWKKDEDGTPKELGLIAQEVEQVFAGLVQDDVNPVSEDDATVYKQVKQSVLPFILLKAIQEQQALITQLQADVAALKGAA